MYYTDNDPQASMDSFRIDGRIMRYSIFVPKFYNLCKSLGFEAGKIMPSRALCSDESQGYPIILIAKHFGAFPFNHGLVGGVVATDRHGPHADHGQDLVIIQASHVGYDPESGKYGMYRRLQTRANEFSASCGKIDGVLDWYRGEIAFASRNIQVSRDGQDWLVTIDNQLLRQDRTEGLFLHLDRLAAPGEQGQPSPIRAFSTSKCFPASAELVSRLGPEFVAPGGMRTIGARLAPDWFYFRRQIDVNEESHGHMECNLLPVMPWILAARSPLLAAAKVNTQVEFDRAYRSIFRDPGYENRRILFISGLNIDISPARGQLFPLTKFIPWAAYLQQPDAEPRIIEQEELFSLIEAQGTDNPDQIDLEDAIRRMSKAREVPVPGE